MLITLVALLCSTLPGPEYCVEEIIVDSSINGMSKFECEVHGQMMIVPWMDSSIKYGQGWRVDHYTCEAGHYVVKGRA